jgi:hypothetical protein
MLASCFADVVKNMKRTKNSLNKEKEAVTVAEEVGGGKNQKNKEGL